MLRTPLTLIEGFQHVHFRNADKVKFKVQFGKGKRTVHGRSFDGKLAIHVIPKSRGIWGVSHMRTGLLLVQTGHDDKQAVRAANQLSRLSDWNFDDPSVLINSPNADKVKEIIGRFYKRAGI